MASLTQQFQRAVQKWAENEGERILRLAREVAPSSPEGYGNTRPGRSGVKFRDGLEVHVRQNGGRVRSIDIDSVVAEPKAVWVRSDYMINAKNAPALVFRTYDGAWHRRTTVFHRADNWAMELLQREEPTILASLAKACDTFLQEYMAKRRK